MTRLSGQCAIPAKQRLVVGGLALAVVIMASACAPAPSHSSALSTTPTRSATPTRLPTQAPKHEQTPTQVSTSTPDPLARIHNVGPNNIPLFVRITFTPSTTYAQAVAILATGSHPTEPYPWTCDEPRSPTPPALPDRQAAYAASHSLLLSYAVWDELVWIASAPQVVAVDGTYVYPCP
jgi:hypothetical protein